MYKRLLLCLALLTACVGCGEPHWNWGASEAAVAGPTDWNVGRKVLAFTKPDCAQCLRDKAMFPTLKRECRRVDADLVIVDGYEYPELANHLGVKQYPTYAVVEDGQLCRTRDGRVAMTVSIWTILKVIKVIFFIAMFFLV